MVAKVQSAPDDLVIDLPMVKVTKEDVYETLFIHTADVDTLYQDALLKMQTWIINYAEELVNPLRECSGFTEAEIEAIKRKICVVSPITLALYGHWLQMDNFAKIPDSEKEKVFLEKIPDRFKARYRKNRANRNAREVSADEMDDTGNELEGAESKERLRKMSFVELVKAVGSEIRKGVGSGHR